MADTKKGLDIAVVMGGPKGSPVADDTSSKDDYGNNDPGEGSDLPEEYVASFRDYMKNPSPQTFWDAVEACVNAKSEVGSDVGLKVPTSSSKFGPMTGASQAMNFMKRNQKPLHND